MVLVPQYVPQGVHCFMQGCPECAIAKSPHHLLAGKLFLLSEPTSTMITPGSERWHRLTIFWRAYLYTCILNRFSKTCQLVPLKRLPTAMEMAETLFQHYGTMTSREHSIWPWFPFYLQSLACLLLPPESARDLLCWLSPTDQNADREEGPGNRMLPEDILPYQPTQQVPIPFLDLVHTKLNLSACDRTHLIPVRACFLYQETLPAGPLVP